MNRVHLCGRSSLYAGAFAQVDGMEATINEAGETFIDSCWLAVEPQQVVLGKNLGIGGFEFRLP
ncbi:hypothetical protein FHT70_003258 [Rhizobium sp. BK049]|nr:hypothetical protein [Rhizobium sp. BK049]